LRRVREGAVEVLALSSSVCCRIRNLLSEGHPGIFDTTAPGFCLGWMIAQSARYCAGPGAPYGGSGSL